MSYFYANREDLERNEDKILAPYACHAIKSKGREFSENPDPQRTCFQRDRDRVIHSRAYRRLKGKTQVFIGHHGDHYRNRLTHTMEVAQLARDLTRNLKGNEDLAETIALAHDLGHTPFGHAGQDAMQEVLAEYDLYFEHNLQSRRIVESLEKKSPKFRGLNLTWEVRDGLMKHRHNQKGEKRDVSKYGFLEAQIADLSDSIAYTNHDLDDGLRSAVINIDELNKNYLWRKASENIPKYSSEKLWISETISSLVSLMTSDLLRETIRRIQKINPETPEDIKNAEIAVVRYSEEMKEEVQVLRRFLYEKFYKQPEVVEQSEKGKKIIKELFQKLYEHPDKLPEEFWNLIAKEGEQKKVVIKDFIAGMTDQFAIDFLESL